VKSLFLNGYGLYIKVQDTRLVFSQGVTPFVEREEPLHFATSKCNFDTVVIQGKGFVSTEALERLAESNINVIMLDKRGKLFSYVHQIGCHEPLIRQKQYDVTIYTTDLDFSNSPSKFNKNLHMLKKIIV